MTVQLKTNPTPLRREPDFASFTGLTALVLNLSQNSRVLR